jgi:hypothetical protein
VTEAKLTTNELKSWLESETGSVLAPVQAQAQKYLSDTKNAVESLSEVSRMLVENSQKEIEKRNMKVYNRARALNKLANLFVDRIKKLKVPEEVSYDNLSIFASETQKTIYVVEVDIKKWFPRISPFFIMDRRKFLPIFEKTKSTVLGLNDFVNKEYVKSKTLEETFQLISEVEGLENQLSDIQQTEEALKKERLLLENEIQDLNKKTAQIKEKATMKKLTHLESEQEKLNDQLKQMLRHLQKPFLKMQALATYGGGGGITPDELRMIGLYMENPYEAISTEDQGYPLLRRILEKLSNFLVEDKLKLKSDKHRKAEQDLQEMLETDELKNLHQKSVAVATNKKQLLASKEMEEAQQSISLCQEQIEALEARKKSIETDEFIKHTQQQELLDKIQTLKKAIETDITRFIDKEVHIQ